MAFGLHVSDHGLDGGTASQLAFDGVEHAALLAGDEDTVWVRGVVAAVSLVDMGALALPLPMHSTSGAWKEYSFQPRWRCCCERVWLARASGQANASSSSTRSAILRRMSRMMRPRRVRRRRNCRR